MANTVGHITFLVFLCIVRLLFVVTVNHLWEKLCFDACVIIFQFSKACYSAQKYICVNQYTIFDNGTKKYYTSLPGPLMLELILI